MPPFILFQNALFFTALLVLLRSAGLRLSDLGFRALPPARLLAEAGWGLAFVFFLAFLSPLLVLFYAAVFPAPPETAQLPRLLGGGDGPLADALFFAAAVGAAPLVEESVYRSLLFVWFAARLPLPLAVAAAAAVFAVGHQPLGVAPIIFVLGLLLSWRFIAGGSLWAPIIAHAAFNAVNLSLFLAFRDELMEAYAALALL